MKVAADAALMERLRVFVASPGDVAAERDHVQAVADELNRGIAAQAGFVLEVVRWETHARPDMGRAEQSILDQVGQYDLFVGIMWRGSARRPAWPDPALKRNSTTRCAPGGSLASRGCSSTSAAHRASRRRLPMRRRSCLRSRSSVRK